MSKKNIKLIAIIALILVSTFILVGRSKSKDVDDIKVTEYKVKKGDIVVGFEAEGTYTTDIVEPSFVSSGKVTSINMSIGSEVFVGSLLATLESTDEYYAMASAKAIYEKAIAAHHAFEALFEGLDKDGFGSEDYKYYEEQENQLREAKRSAEALYDKSRYSLDKSNLYSPIEGTVIDIYINEGETVQNQNQATPIMSILPTNKTAYIESFVEDLDISKVKVDMKVKYTPDALEDKDYSGTVSFISPKGITDNNGLVTYKVRISIEDDAGLFDGFIGSIIFLSRSQENVLVIPNKAVRMIEGVQYVFKYPETDEKLKIVTGLTDGTSVEVVEGLNQNDTIAITE